MKKVKAEAKTQMEKRFDAIIAEFIMDGGFTEQQAIYLVNLLNNYIPLV